jgi:hypothetical protein
MLGLTFDFSWNPSMADPALESIRREAPESPEPASCDASRHPAAIDSFGFSRLGPVAPGGATTRFVGAELALAEAEGGNFPGCKALKTHEMELESAGCSPRREDAPGHDAWAADWFGTASLPAPAKILMGASPGRSGIQSQDCLKAYFAKAFDINSTIALTDPMRC